MGALLRVVFLITLSVVITEAGRQPLSQAAGTEHSGAQSRSVPRAAGSDVDGDGVIDGVDNCPNIANADQVNTDGMMLFSVHPVSPPVANPPPGDRTRPVGDAFGDACDPDDDNDGIADDVEQTLGVPSPPGPCVSATAALDPANHDTDGDAAMDGAECALGTDPADGGERPTLTACAAHLGVAITADSDADGIRDAVEFCGYGSSHLATDTDLDGCEDGLEIASVDANGAVNSTDLLIVALQFSRTDRLVQDVDRNGIVNSSDLLLVALNFGKLC